MGALSFKHTLGWAGLSVGLWLGSAQAEVPSSSVAAEPPLQGADKERAAATEQALASGDANAVLPALASLKENRHPIHGRALGKLLRRGASERVLLEALAVAQGFPQHSLSVAIAPYLQHRSAAIRIAAAEALAKTGGPEAVAALARGLRSQDGKLRGACALGLGTLADPSAQGVLIAALDRGILVAAASLGRLCDDVGCRQLADRVERVPLEALSDGLVEAIVRTDERVTSPVKVELIARVANLRTPKALALLRAAKSRWATKGDPTVKAALSAAIDSFGGM